MKTLLLTIATLATLMAGAALAGPISNSASDMRAFNSIKQLAFQNGALGIKATDFMGARETNELMTGAQRINVYEATNLLTFDGGGQTIILKPFRPSGH